MSEGKSLRSEINLLGQQNAALERQNALLEQQLRSAQDERRALLREIEALKRRLFGPRSEQVSHAELVQATLGLGQESTAQSEAPSEVIGYTRRTPKPSEAKPLPDHLETITEEIIPPEVLAEPQAYERIGEEVTEELDVLPMRVIKRRIIRPKFKRKNQPDAAPFTAALPPRVIPGGLPAAGLIAYLIVAKYVDHLPLYRLEKAFAQRHGIKIPRQRLCDWIGYATENWLALIHRQIRENLLKNNCLQIDDEARQREDGLAEGAAPKRSAGAN